MPREDEKFIQDILRSIDKIEQYLSDLDKKQFLNDSKTREAVLYNLENIGEASKNISNKFKHQNSEIDWEGMSGFRDFIVHQYFKADPDIVWDITQNKLPELKEKLD